MSDFTLRKIGLNPGRFNSKGNRDKNNDKGLLNISCREPLLIYSTIPPWRTQDVYKVKFFTTLIDKCTKSDENEKKLDICNRTITARGDFNIELWTDASVVNKKGAGAGYIFFIDKPEITVTGPAGNICSSYSAELVAIDITIDRLIQELDSIENTQHYPYDKILIVSDSQSSISALESGPLNQITYINSYIWKKLLILISKYHFNNISFQFVYSHCGIMKNEMVDQLASDSLKDKYKSNFKHYNVPISLSQIKTYFKSKLFDKETKQKID